MRTRIWTPVIDLLFPPRCALCGAMVSDHNGLCATCWAGLEVPGQPACAACAMPFAHAGAEAGRTQSIDPLHPHEADLCLDCRDTPPSHDGIRAATIYNHTARRLIIGLKHGRRVALAPMLGRLMAARLHGDLGQGDLAQGDLAQGDLAQGRWLVVPVPLHRWRLWHRGFNQSALLGAEVARHHGARLMVDALVRRRPTPSLGGLGKAERARVLRDAITVHPRRAAMLRGAKVLLVDDVLTSGATTNACIAALRAAGAARVVVACFARVTDGGWTDLIDPP
ncbi:ComF family protein [Novosphingobium sp. FSY-8]|uniref:ComF family protein n=1 Tax=Novosphingobium ovatum TaxID=1908523 RepID=A0ABW9XCV2_9SPHN|nr:ComF family protein [Novosphingobium ovatum]NBC36302.1 ComF family protein [Novosphingobium ovatum]